MANRIVMEHHFKTLKIVLEENNFLGRCDDIQMNESGINMNWICDFLRSDLCLLMFFSLIALEKRDQKHFLVDIKVKEELFDIDKCVLERVLKL